MLRASAIAALLLIPTLAQAQRTNRGNDLYGDWNKADPKMGRPAPTYKQSDVEKFSAVLLLVDKKKDLKLTDDQMAKLKDLGKAEEAVNKVLYGKMDSTRLALRQKPGEDSDQERARMTLARQEFMAVIQQIRSSYDSTYKTSCAPILDEGQRKTAEELIQKASQEAEEELRSKIGGGTRGAGGGGGRRP
jgi:hypothetical protein